MNYSFFIRLAHMEKYFPIKENGTSVWAFALHVIEVLSVMRSQELCSDWTCSGCVLVRLEEFSLLSLHCNAIESHIHTAQFYAGSILTRM